MSLRSAIPRTPRADGSPLLKAEPRAQIFRHIGHLS